MGDERFGIAQIVGDQDHRKIVRKRESASCPPLTSMASSVEPRFICFLARSYCGWLSMMRIDDPGDLGMAFQRFRDFLGAVRHLLDAQREGFKTLGQHPGIEGESVAPVWRRKVWTSPSMISLDPSTMPPSTRP